MDDKRLLEELIMILEQNGVTVRHEPLGGSGGGLCHLKGKQFFFVDTQAASADCASVCAEAVVRLVDLETVYIRPQIRQFIHAHTNI